MGKIEQEIIILDFQDWCVREGYMYWGEHEGHPQLFTRENMDYIEQEQARSKYIEYFKGQQQAKRKLEAEKKKAEQVSLMK